MAGGFSGKVEKKGHTFKGKAVMYIRYDGSAGFDTIIESMADKTVRLAK